jgi:C4-dicarboxylate-binding protein DctP
MFDLVANELSAYMMPFLFNSQEDFIKIARGPIGDEIAACGLKNGVAVLSTGDAGGLRHWTNNVRPIVTPDDMKGLKIRTPGVEAIIKIIEAIGGNPVAIDYGELYMALKTGVVDGQENPIINIYDKKFYEVQKYITMSNYQIHPDPFYVSSIWFDALPDYLQDIVSDAAKEMMIYSDKLMLEKEQAFLPTIEENMEVTYLTDEQRQVFIDVTSSVTDYFVNEGWFTADLVQRMRDELK